MPDNAVGLFPKFNAIDAAELTERCGEFAADWITAIRQRDELYAALEAIIKLQAHYATLLNMHDGGERIAFKSADEWLARRREIFALAKARGKSDAG